MSELVSMLVCTLGIFALMDLDKWIDKKQEENSKRAYQKLIDLDKKISEAMREEE